MKKHTFLDPQEFQQLEHSHILINAEISAQKIGLAL